MKLLDRILSILIKRRFYRFTEHNKEEDETWNFYVPLKSSEMKKIRKAIKGDPRYNIGIQTYSADAVDAIISSGQGWGYHPAHNRQSGVCLPDTIDLKKHDIFNKGMCWI